MITNLHILNFQSHKDTSLDFAPGVNVIVGASDSGKTAILRALRWLIWNRPSGEAFRSMWGGDTEVGIWIDGFGFKRIKGKENLYIAGIEEHPDSNPIVLEGFGQDVPKDIQKALNINEINLQRQLDPHFLISKSAGEVASFFNQIAHLDQIDSGLKYLSGQIRNLEEKRKFLSDRQKEVTTALDKYSNLNEIEEAVTQAEKAEKQQTQYIADIEILTTTCQELEFIDESLVILEEEAEFNELVEETLEAIQDLKERKGQNTQLSVHLSEIRQNVKEIVKVRTLIKLEPQVKAIFEMMSSRDTLYEKFWGLDKLVGDIEENEAEAKAILLTLSTKEKEFELNMPDTCPLCGSRTWNART